MEGMGAKGVMPCHPLGRRMPLRLFGNGNLMGMMETRWECPMVVWTMVKERIGV